MISHIIPSNASSRIQAEEALASLLDLVGPSITLDIIAEHLVEQGVAEAPTNAHSAKRRLILAVALGELAAINRDLS